MFSPMRELARRPEGKVLIASAVSTVAVGTVAYSLLEGWSLLDSLYFCVVTLATIGFGDLHPTTDLAKLFTVGYIVVGVGIIAGFLSELGKQRYTKIEGRIEGRVEAAEASPDARTEPDSKQR
jgi:hypothetical protein